MDKNVSENLAKIAKAMEEGRIQYSKEVEEYWNSLTMEEKEKSFYYVCSKIHENDVIKQGSYRYGLYDIFKFDASMYGAGMDCGYMAVHNLIHDGIEFNHMKRAEAISIRYTPEDNQEITLPDNFRFSYDEESNKIVIKKINGLFD